MAENVLRQGRKLPASLQRTFADVLAQNNPQQQRQRFGNQQKQNQIEFSLKGCVQRDGIPVVKFKEAEWRKLAEVDESLTLVGIFVQKRPSIDVIRSSFQKLIPIGGAAQIGAVDARSILLRFDSEKDCMSVLMRGQVIVDGKVVRFARWSPDWRKKRNSPIVLAWIQLPNLPFHLFNSGSLPHICAPIGKLVGLDAPTEKRIRPSVARVRIELDLRQKRVDKIRLEIWGENGEVVGFW